MVNLLLGCGIIAETKIDPSLQIPECVFYTVLQAIRNDLILIIIIITCIKKKTGCSNLRNVLDFYLRCFICSYFI